MPCVVYVCGRRGKNGPYVDRINATISVLDVGNQPQTKTHLEPPERAERHEEVRACEQLSTLAAAPLPVRLQQRDVQRLLAAGGGQLPHSENGGGILPCL
jgi:hypothetical protein